MNRTDLLIDTLASLIMAGGLAAYLVEHDELSRRDRNRLRKVHAVEGREFERLSSLLARWEEEEPGRFSFDESNKLNAAEAFARGYLRVLARASYWADADGVVEEIGAGLKRVEAQVQKGTGGALLMAHLHLALAHLVGAGGQKKSDRSEASGWAAASELRKGA